MTKLPKFSLTLLNPRYFPLWLGTFVLWCIVLLPYPLLYRFGSWLGRKVVMRLLPRRVSIARRNLELCFLTLSENEIEILLRKNFESVGMGVIETGIAWFWSDSRLRKWFTVIGYEHMKNARRTNNGVLLIGMHFLTLELGARILGMLNPGVGVYRPNSNALYNWLQTRGRLRCNKTMLDRHNLKGMIRALKHNEIIWYAPDHDYGPRSSVFVPFFGVSDVATTTGSYILVKSARPTVVPFVPRRKSDGRGYELIILPDISSDLYEQNKEVVSARMNKAIEEAIRLAPEQYMWLHRRFKTRPEGKPPLYSKKK